MKDETTNSPAAVEKILVPNELKGTFQRGCHITYGKCLIKLSRTKQWRKATMCGSTFIHGQVNYQMEPCEEYPEGGMHTLSTDGRFGDGDIDDVRLVPEEMWDFTIKQDELTAKEKMVMNLKARNRSGEQVLSESEKCKAADWIIVQIGNDSKYGRVAYSPSLDVMRGLTFDEFYGGGIVD